MVSTIICFEEYYDFFIKLSMLEGFPCVHQCTREKEIFLKLDTKHIHTQVDANFCSILSQLEAKFPKCFKDVFVGFQLVNIEADFEVSSSKLVSTLSFWSRDTLIELWFYKFILYDINWMYLYMKGSQPWHVAIKWCTCNSLVMLRRCTKWACNVNLCGEYGRCIIALYGVFCVSWIKFQPLHFALYEAIGIEFLDQGVCGIRVLKFWENFNHRVCQVLTVALTSTFT